MWALYSWLAHFGRGDTFTPRWIGPHEVAIDIRKLDPMFDQVFLELSLAHNSAAIKKMSNYERPRCGMNSPSSTFFFGAEIGTFVLFLTVSGA